MSDLICLMKYENKTNRDKTVAFLSSFLCRDVRSDDVRLLQQLPHAIVGVVVVEAAVAAEDIVWREEKKKAPHITSCDPQT